MAKVLAVEMVRIAVPFGVLMALEDRVAVTPAGNVPKCNATGELKLFCPTMLTVVLKEAPAVSVMALTSVFKVNPGTLTTLSA